jgi:hypothetical protein
MLNTPDTLEERENIFTDNAIDAMEKLLADIEECYGLSRTRGVELICQTVEFLWQGVKYDSCAPISQVKFHARDALVNLAKVEMCCKCLKEQLAKLIKGGRRQNDTEN